MDDEEIRRPPTNHLVATVDNLTDMLDFDSEDIDGMDDDAGDEEEPLPTGHWTTTSSYDIYMVDTPKEGNGDETTEDDPSKKQPKRRRQRRRSKSRPGKSGDTGTGDNSTPSAALSGGLAPPSSCSKSCWRGLLLSAVLSGVSLSPVPVSPLLFWRDLEPRC